MKTKILKITTLALMPVALLTVMSCSSNKMKAVETTSVVDMADGVIIVDTITLDATVIAKDADKRKITLESSASGKSTYKVGPDMANFDALQVGDQVSATVVEEMAVYLGGAPSEADAAGEVMVAPDGFDATVMETQQVTVDIVAVDARKHRITCQLPDGSTKKIKVNKKTDLTQVQVGDNVTLQMGEGLALSVQTQ